MQETSQRTTEWVNATVKENLWAGLGAATLAWVGGYAWAGYSDALFVVSGLTGGGFFGALCVIRFTSDERGIVWDAHMQRVAENEIMRLEAENAELRSELKRVAVRVKTQEFNQASRNARDVVAPDKHAQLRSDAQGIIKRWGSGARFGRDHCEMGRARWEGATRFLVDCGVMVVEDGPRASRVFADGMTQARAEARVRQAIEKMEQFAGTNFTPALS